ncbi:ankyrin repeat domain-containing protein [Dactylosporangium sp. McL0621]|uniref:ankyrin repeat domain-containing protein n=1 Tax=Dactylosporangium sp. McL0621 TaxID=3415678 RepID=UPI003CF65907
MDALRRGPLHLAAQAGDAQRVAQLIAEGTVVDARDSRMYTPLHIAAGMGHAEVVAALVAGDADAGALTTFRSTPLHAVAHGRVGSGDARVEVVDSLLTAGCPLNAVDSSGRTALWYAASTGTTPWTPEQHATCFRVLQHLLERGADPNIAARGKQGRRSTPPWDCTKPRSTESNGSKAPRYWSSTAGDVRWSPPAHQRRQMSARWGMGETGRQMTRTTRAV